MTLVFKTSIKDVTSHFDLPFCRMSANKQCAICKDASYPLVSVTRKGLASLIEFSSERKDNNLNEYFNRKYAENKKITGVYVHEKCRRDYNNRKRVSSIQTEAEVKKPKFDTRISTEFFSWKQHCFLCVKVCAVDPKHPDRSDCHHASTLEIRASILRICRQRFDENKDDEWTLQVQRRVNSCIDLVAAEARYHSACYTRFSSKKQGNATVSTTFGRTKNEKMRMIFVKAFTNWIPNYLRQFLHVLIESEIKVESIGQAIIKSSTRAALTPMLFCLGVELDHVFGSKWLLDHLARLGFSITSDEVKLFKHSVLMSGNHDREITNLPDSSFAQWSADNVDHNTATLDGKGTFHGMGVIVSVTPINTNLRSQAIKRLKTRSLVSDVVTDKGIHIKSFSGKMVSFPTFKPYANLKEIKLMDFSYDMIWHSGWIFSSKGSPRPNWSGFMQQSVCMKEIQYEQSDVFLLPIIDLPATDLNCIYSTLLFIQDQAKKMNISPPCVTFDQPLWYKASGIIAEKNLNIICRLGGFHTLMSFLGSVGDMMAGSGIEDLLALVYAENSVSHVMSGKAFARALRAHFLVDSCLNNLLLDEIRKKAEGKPEYEEHIDCLRLVY